MGVRAFIRIFYVKWHYEESDHKGHGLSWNV